MLYTHAFIKILFSIMVAASVCFFMVRRIHRINKIQRLDWESGSSKRIFLRNCKIYLSQHGWAVKPPWSSYTDVHIYNDKTVINLIIVVKRNVIHRFFIDDARQAMRETQQIVAIIVNYEPSISEYFLAKDNNIPLLYYRDLPSLMTVAIESKAIEAQRYVMPSCILSR